MLLTAFGHEKIYIQKSKDNIFYIPGKLIVTTSYHLLTYISQHFLTPPKKLSVSNFGPP